ncbi:hypothetical protein BDV28DRAFT_132481 [Aspergillus coremiiformis]|uniref:Uncharacterized protein n=1 Tax=Aspergillus coremiiformis TaxID=138285 RepID=A0A5N6ZAC9_9EURO|nr:hypothetical protein BDV28DRAFT_132481 [Aspergillus coremiiformis]
MEPITISGLLLAFFLATISVDALVTNANQRVYQGVNQGANHGVKPSRTLEDAVFGSMEGRFPTGVRQS